MGCYPENSFWSPPNRKFRNGCFFPLWFPRHQRVGSGGRLHSSRARRERRRRAHHHIAPVPPANAPAMTAPSSDAGVKKPRLVIKKMVLENFKSYAGAQHVGPFHKVRAIPATSPVLSIDAASYRDVRGSRYRPNAPEGAPLAPNLARLRLRVGGAGGERNLVRDLPARSLLPRSSLQPRSRSPPWLAPTEAASPTSSMRCSSSSASAPSSSA